MALRFIDLIFIRVRLRLRVHRDNNFLEGVILLDLFVAFCQLEKNVLSKLVNRFVHLARIGVRLVFEHVVSIELDSVAKHPDSLL